MPRYNAHLEGYYLLEQSLSFFPPSAESEDPLFYNSLAHTTTRLQFKDGDSEVLWYVHDEMLESVSRKRGRFYVDRPISAVDDIEYVWNCWVLFKEANEHEKKPSRPRRLSIVKENKE